MEIPTVDFDRAVDFYSKLLKGRTWKAGFWNRKNGLPSMMQRSIWAPDFKPSKDGELWVWIVETRSIDMAETHRWIQWKNHSSENKNEARRTRLVCIVPYRRQSTGALRRIASFNINPVILKWFWVCIFWILQISYCIQTAFYELPPHTNPPQHYRCTLSSIGFEMEAPR